MTSANTISHTGRFREYVRSLCNDCCFILNATKAQFVLFLQSTLEELNVGKNRYRIVRQMIALAMERHAPSRELISLLVSELYGEFLLEEDMKKGFDETLKSLEDLTLDTPDAPDVGA